MHSRLDLKSNLRSLCLIKSVTRDPSRFSLPYRTPRHGSNVAFTMLCSFTLCAHNVSLCSTYMAEVLHHTRNSRSLHVIAYFTSNHLDEGNTISGIYLIKSRSRETPLEIDGFNEARLLTFHFSASFPVFPALYTSFIRQIIRIMCNVLPLS